jgi:gas vesicle protein
MRDNPGTDVMAFLVGGLAGACLGLLLAPRTGRETRGLVAARLRRGEQVACRGFVQGRQVVVTKIREGRELAKRTVERGQAAVKEVSRVVREAAPGVPDRPQA